MPRRFRHHHRHHPKDPRRLNVWQRLKRVHRRILLLVLLSVALGWAVGLLLGSGQWIAGSISGVLVLVLIVPWLSFVGTWRILGPMRRLAFVARQLREGELEAREAIDTDDDEVEPVASALRGMADRVSRQLDTQRALMGAVSHELRSPLARARVLVEMSREGSAPPDLADRLDEEIAAMDSIVGDLLAASRIDFDAVQPSALTLVGIAERAAEGAALRPDQLRIHGEAALMADPTLVDRALGVLLHNAQTHGGGVVALEAEPRVDEVHFTVLDEGPGFGPDEAEHAFEPFWRKAGADAASGLGLGLALVQRIAEAHGGRAEAGNRPEGGAWVRLTLPVDERTHP